MFGVCNTTEHLIFMSRMTLQATTPIKVETQKQSDERMNRLKENILTQLVYNK